MGHKTTLLVFIPFFFLFSCLQKEESDANSGSGDAGTVIAVKKNDQRIGSACSCEGDLCTVAGAPTINRGTILGCDDVPKDWPGGDRGCLRSYQGDYSITTHYPKGFCTLVSIDCEGADELCNPSKKGNYELMTSCPENSVLLTTYEIFTVVGLSADIYQKFCLPTCEKDSDCRIDEYDDFFDKPGQYQCLEENGVKFCDDPRNLPDDHTVEAF